MAPRCFVSSQPWAGIENKSARKDTALLQSGLQLGRPIDRLRRARTGAARKNAGSKGRSKVKVVRLAMAVLAALTFAALGSAGAEAQQTKNQVFKEWTLDCATPKPAQGSTVKPKTVCLIHHEVHDPSDGTKIQLIARTRFLGPDRKPYFILLLPPAANLQKGVRLQVDKNTVYQAKIEACYQQSCTSGFPLSEDLIKQFRSGTQLNVAYLLNPEGQVKTVVPLAGFVAALEALQKTGS